MSVLIEGMEIPNTCCDCPFTIYDKLRKWDDGEREAEGAWVCKLTREVIYNTKREDHCPLSEIEMDKVTLTPDECEALEEYLWLSLIPFVQDENNEVDNLMYLRLLTGIWEKCKLFNDVRRKRKVDDILEPYTTETVWQYETT